MNKETKFDIQVRKLDEKVLLVQFPQIIDEALLNFIIGLKAAIDEQLKDIPHQVFNTYAEICVHYLNKPRSFNEELDRLKRTIERYQAEQSDQDHLARTSKFRIPVCYEQGFARDIQFVASHNVISKEEVVRIHQQPIYRVYFIGFLPGFPYLGGMSKKISTPRKKQARKRVQKGDVGIAGDQTGLYPVRSPGGWQIIGNSPIDLIDFRENDDVLLKAGDLMEFYPISREEHRAILYQEKKINLKENV